MSWFKVHGLDNVVGVHFSDLIACNVSVFRPIFLGFIL